MRLTLSAVLVMLLSVVSAPTKAITEPQEWAARIKTAESIGVLGTNLFGDSTNYYNGQTTFTVTDVDLPGNNSLPVRVTRSHSATPDYSEGFPAGLMGTWDLDVPYVSGIYSTQLGWTVSGSNPYARCSDTSNPAPPTVGTHPNTWLARTYWRGLTLSVPGAGKQTLLRPSSNVPEPTDGLGRKLVTSSFWQTRCGVSLANPGSSPGYSGEGFLVLGPDGTKYTMNWMTTRSSVTLTRNLGVQLTRVEVRIYATRVEDRFGNYVNYEWNGSRLERITASDGRQISFTYNASNQIETATAHGRVWTYGYATGQYYLNKVTLPDSSTWSIATRALSISYDPAGPPPDCLGPDTWLGNQRTTFTFKHPSGAVGEFVFTPTRHGRTQIAKDCTQNVDGVPNLSYGSPLLTDNIGLASKKISGPGLTPQQWSMAWSPAIGCFATQSGCPTTKYVDVTAPDASITRYTYGIRYYIDEGKLISTALRKPDNTVLRTTTYSYATAPTNPPYAYAVGTIGVINDDSFAARFIVPRTQTTITQRSDITQPFDTYTNTVNSFDNFAREVSVTRSNSFNGTRTDVAAYHDDTARWVIGQVKSSTNTNTGLVESVTNYDANTALPVSTYRFGLLNKTATYNADGTLATIANGLNQTTTYSNWKRGFPQTIVYADNSSSSAVIDDYGLITSVTDERSNTTSYGYDSLGRLASVNYPAGDSQAWSPKAMSFMPLAAAELGVPAGAWRLRLTEGNHQKSVYLDARYNPILEEERDTASGAARYLKRSFDYEGRATFSSYPSSTSSATAGINSVYGPLGRMTSQQTSDGVTLATISYLSSNRRQTTDADGKTTTISYQAFDQPAYESPTLIASPEGQTTTIARDVFGKMNSVNQSGLFQGSNLSYTRHYRYDIYQRLCGRLDPESGTTGWGYDLASRLVWELKGQTETSCVTDVISPSATRYTYDARGRKILDDYRNTAYDVSYGYDAAGNLTSVSNPAASWTYSYNKRNLLETEQAQIDGRTYGLTSVYNSIANVTNTIYPDSLNIAYAPDALGRPTQMLASCCGLFVGSIQHHANGLVSSYNLGNGLSYTQGIDTRQRPSLQETKSGNTAIQRLAYSYSLAGDLKVIDDQVDNADDATLEYDDLHRLEIANGLWGSYTYQYDAINNLRGRTGTNALSYSYDAAKNRLSSVGGSASRSYGYDARGRISADGSRNYTWNDADQITAIPSVASYVYDGNGKRIKTIKAGGVIEYTLYSRSGTLAYVDRSNNTHSAYLQLDGKTIAEVTNGGPTYLHPDLLGSPRMATNSTGGTVYSEHYGPYGEKLNGVSAKIGYTGHAYDAESGLMYAQARFYDAAVGRFLSIDPVGFADDSFSFNRYGYANNSPYKYGDPDGREATPFSALAGYAQSQSLMANVSQQQTKAAYEALQSYTPGYETRQQVGSALSLGLVIAAIPFSAQATILYASGNVLSAAMLTDKALSGSAIGPLDYITSTASIAGLPSAGFLALGLKGGAENFISNAFAIFNGTFAVTGAAAASTNPDKPKSSSESNGNGQSVQKFPGDIGYRSDFFSDNFFQAPYVLNAGENDN